MHIHDLHVSIPYVLRFFYFKRSTVQRSSSGSRREALAFEAVRSGPGEVAMGLMEVPSIYVPAKLVNITPMSLWFYDTYIGTIFTGVYKQAYDWGPHIVVYIRPIC